MNGFEWIRNDILKEIGVSFGLPTQILGGELPTDPKTLSAWEPVRRGCHIWVSHETGITFRATFTIMVLFPSFTL